MTSKQSYFDAEKNNASLAQKQGRDLQQLFGAGLAAVIVMTTVLGAALLSLQDLAVGYPSPPTAAIAVVTAEGPLTTIPVATVPVITVVATLAPTPTSTATPTATATPHATEPTPRNPTLTPSPTRWNCGHPPSDWALYILEPGDTLFSLARRHGTTVELIKLHNCLYSDRIWAGQRLYLPEVDFVVEFVTPTPVQPSDTVAAPTLSPPTLAPSSTPLPPTPRPTPTASSTSLPTVSPTVEATATASPAVTATATTTATATSKPSQTPSPTATVTPEPSWTPSPTATDTPLPSNTPTASAIVSPTATATVSVTVSATPAPAATPLPNGTPLPTATTESGAARRGWKVVLRGIITTRLYSPSLARPWRLTDHLEKQNLARWGR